MPRALVTGASGFVGSYLVRHLLELGYEVTGGMHGSHADLPGECRRVGMDVTNREELQRTVAEIRPHEVYHLAGLSRPSAGAVANFYRVNFEGSLNLLETVREHAPDARVLLVGSAYAYGRVSHPIPETEPLQPVNHYGVSKASVDLLGYSYALEGLQVINARPFNHSGPGQSPDFVLPTLVRQFVEIKVGKREPIVRLGNLNSVRDFSDVRDIVRGYRLALRRGRAGEAYNLGSGRGVSVRELFEHVSEEAGMEVELSIEPLRERATDIPYLVAEVSKASRDLGWKTEIPLGHTIRDMLDSTQRELTASGRLSKS